MERQPPDPKPAGNICFRTILCQKLANLAFGFAEFLVLNPERPAEMLSFIIVHSSLIKKYDLRFDETLSFDLYVEDFCIQAREKYGIVSKILPLKCQHYSYGNVSKRFYELLKYMRKKYKKSNRIYYSTVEGELISCPFPRLACYFLPRLRNVLRFFYQSKFTKQNKRLIKICKIPVYIKGEKE